MGLERVTEIICTQPESPRALSATQVADSLADLGVTIRVIEDVSEALLVGQSNARDQDGVVVMGSLYVVGAARGAFRRLTSTNRE
jgi:folylpolyglutamate synthase/dihydropteroate synthase